MDNTNKYIHADIPDQIELKRLQLLEDMFDENSKLTLLKAGLNQGMKVLEIGPGAGSVLQWMSEIVSPEGIAYGVDIDPKFVKHLDSESIRIIQSKIEDLIIDENSFDLVHARNVIIHIQDSLSAISSVQKLLKSGGVFVLEELDLNVGEILRGKTKDISKKMKKMGKKLFDIRGLNSSYGLYAASELVECGFKIENIELNFQVLEKGSKLRKFQEVNIKSLEKAVIETGEVTKEELEIYLEDDPNEIGFSFGMFSIIGKKLI